MGYSNGITNNPGATFENMIKPAADTPSLILRPFSDAQANSVFQVKNAAGSTVHFGLNPAGEVELANGVGTSGQVPTSAGAGSPVAWATPAAPDFSPTVILAPNSVNRNLIQPTADANKGLVLKDHSASQSAPLIEFRDSDDNLYALLKNVNSGQVPAMVVGSVPADLSAIADQIYSQGNGEAIITAGRGSGFGFATVGVVQSGSKIGTANTTWYTQNPSAAQQLASIFSIAGVQTQANDGTISGGRVTALDSAFNVIFNYDTPTRAWTFTSFSAATSPVTLVGGASLKIGFLGANAVVRQTNGTAAALAAVADGNVKSFLTAISTALVNLGLLAAPA